MILCNPHNPVSRCWNREELEWIGAKGLEHGVLIVSDEIHCDLVFSPHQHIPLATLSEEIAQNTITCIAPSKTFNLAGLYSSSIIIANDSLRRRFKFAEEKIHLSANIFGITASEAAYRDGQQWLDFRKLGLPAPEIKKRLIEKAGLGFVEGPVFGPGGEGFQRMNIACPRDTLKQALGNLKNILNG